MNAKEALSLARGELASRLEAERIVAHVLKCRTSELWLKEHQSVDEDWVKAAVKRRQSGEPLAYILESQGFYNYDFYVRPGVLIPRPETEHLIERALELFAQQSPLRIADLGCGSGCIGLTLLKEWPNSKLLAIDASETAIQIAKENAERLHVTGRCEFRHACVEQGQETEAFELIVANPPYIDINDPRVEPHVRHFEPAEALFADQNGLAALFSWSEWAHHALKDGGWLLMEIGTGQAGAVKDKLSRIGFPGAEVIKDLAGHERLIAAKKPDRGGSNG